MTGEKGQIGMMHISGIGVTILIAIAGFWIAQSNMFNSKIEAVKTDVSSAQVNIGKLQTQSEQYQRDIADINAKLDKILFKLK